LVGGPFYGRSNGCSQGCWWLELNSD
jgi:hypothetical protein